MDLTTLHEIVLPLVGIAFVLVVLALIGVALLRRPAGQRFDPVDITWMGVTAKGDCRTILILACCVMALVPVAIWYLGQQFRVAKHLEELKQGQDELKREQARANMAEQALQRFKFYDLRVNVRFPEPIDTRTLVDHLQAYVYRPGGGAPQVSVPKSEVSQGNDLWVYIERLNPGDRLRIAVSAGGATWRSDEIEVPTTRVQMTRQ